MSTELILGLVTGILFGVLLQKGRVLRYEKQVGFLRLMDMTIIKFMFSAILVGMVGIHLLKDFGMISLSLKGLNLGAQIVGGTLFGIGWGLFGYCPGTAIGALGEGRRHAIWGVLGMLVGAAVYAEIYPTIKGTVLSWADYGKVSIPELIGINHWIVVVVFVAAILGLFRLLEKKHL